MKTIDYVTLAEQDANSSDVGWGRIQSCKTENLLGGGGALKSLVEAPYKV